MYNLNSEKDDSEGYESDENDEKRAVTKNQNKLQAMKEFNKRKKKPKAGRRYLQLLYN